jgi:hypothetical protein
VKPHFHLGLEPVIEKIRRIREQIDIAVNANDLIQLCKFILRRAFLNVWSRVFFFTLTTAKYYLKTAKYFFIYNKYFAL